VVRGQGAEESSVGEREAARWLVAARRRLRFFRAVLAREQLVRRLAGSSGSSRPNKTLRGSRYRGAGTRPPWIVPGARSSGDSVTEQRNQTPGHASDRTAGPSRPRWPARREQATIYFKSRQSLQSVNTPVHLSFNFVISPGQKFSKCPNVSEFEAGSGPGPR